MENNPTTGKWFEQGQSRKQEAPAPARIHTMASVIADFMVWLTILGEKRSNRRAARKAMIISRWLQLSGDSLKVPFPGVVMI